MKNCVECLVKHLKLAIIFYEIWSLSSEHSTISEYTQEDGKTLVRDKRDKAACFVVIFT